MLTNKNGMITMMKWYDGDMKFAKWLKNVQVFLATLLTNIYAGIQGVK